MNISGKAVIFKKDFNGKEMYSTSISNKMADGSMENMYISVQLPKGKSLENKSTIDVTKGFISFYKDKNGLAKPKFVIMEYNEEINQEIPDISDNNPDLPF